MGIGRSTLELFSNLYKKGFFDSIKSVIELGSQEVHIETKRDIAVFLKSIGVKNINDEIKKAYSFKRTIRHKMLFPYRFPAKKLYGWLGIKDYESIDSNGDFGAHVFDLNKDIRKTYKYKEQFDLVTNFGTTEHVFDQHMCFKNIHNLTKSGGYMLHGVPLATLDKNINHCFYCINPPLYKDLAVANNYTLTSMWLQINDKIIKPYSENILRNKSTINSPSNLLIYCILRKNSQRAFEIPHQGSYAGVSKLDYVKEKMDGIKFSKHTKRPLLAKIAKRILEIKI